MFCAMSSSLCLQWRRLKLLSTISSVFLLRTPMRRTTSPRSSSNLLSLVYIYPLHLSLFPDLWLATDCHLAWSELMVINVISIDERWYAEELYNVDHPSYMRVLRLSCLSTSYKAIHLWSIFFLYLGSVPVVVGAPNIQDFAPSPDSIIHIKQMTDIEPVAKRMKHLADHPDAYNKMLRCCKKL